MRTVLHTGNDPFWNQALEEFLFTRYTHEDIFYLWQNTPAVIVGSCQNICREVCVPLLREKGIPIVRRMTGGGTVYHDLGNVNYTLLTAAPETMDYGVSLDPVVAALQAIGVPARRNRACDIAIGEEKISGSAQKLSGGRLLHHGTLLFSSDLHAVDALTAGSKNHSIEARGIQSSICSVTNIAPHLAVPMTIAQFMSALTSQMVPPDAEPIVLSTEEQAEVTRLSEEKYKSWQWAWGKTPSYTYDKSAVLEGAPIRIQYSVKKGLLSGVRIESPVPVCQAVAEALEGAKLCPDTMEALCRAALGNRWQSLFNILL